MGTTYTRSALDRMAREIREERGARGRECPRMSCRRVLKYQGWFIDVGAGCVDLVVVWECSDGHVEMASAALTGVTFS